MVITNSKLTRCKSVNSCFLSYIYIYRNFRPGANLTIDPSVQEGSGDHAISSGSQRDSKLELFGFDSLVNILGLKRYDPSFYNFI